MRPVQAKETGFSNLIQDCGAVGFMMGSTYLISRIFQCTVATPAAVALLFGTSEALSRLIDRGTGGLQAHPFQIFKEPIIWLGGQYLVNRMGYPIGFYSWVRVLVWIRPLANIVSLIRERADSTAPTNS